MTLGKLLSLAYYGAGLDDYVTAKDCEEIREFTDMWDDYKGIDILELNIHTEDQMDELIDYYISVGYYDKKNEILKGEEKICARNGSETKEVLRG